MAEELDEKIKAILWELLRDEIGMGTAVELLMALRAASPQQAGTEPLAWEETEDEDGIWAWEARPHRYEIFHKAGDVETRGIQLAYNREILGFWPSLDDAKSAAQAHYLAVDPSAFGFVVKSRLGNLNFIEDEGQAAALRDEGLTVTTVYAAAPSGAGDARGIEDYKWLDPRCHNGGCQSLVFKNLLSQLVKTSAAIDAEIAEFGKPVSTERYEAWNDAIDKASSLVASYSPPPINEDSPPTP